MFFGPNTSIRMMATMITVMFPSKMAEKLFWSPFEMAESSGLPVHSSSLMRVAVMMLASTPIPMERIIPAKPGSVSVKLFRNGK